MSAVFDQRGAEWKSGVLALLVHALFFLLLVFGLSWRVEKKAPPVQAQLWMSLPPVAGSVPQRPQTLPAPTPPTRTSAARPVRAKPAVVPRPRPAASNHRLPTAEGNAIRLRSAPRNAPQRNPAAPTEGRPRLPDLATLASQAEIAAAAVTRSSVFQQIHNPHSITARYYLAALLQKIQHVGDVIYTGKGVGTVAVYLIVGADGNVQALQIDGVSGDSSLPDFAHEIIDRSAPFQPFPADLAKETSQIKLEVQMQFLGMHQVNF